MTNGIGTLDELDNLAKLINDSKASPKKVGETMVKYNPKFVEVAQEVARYFRSNTIKPLDNSIIKYLYYLRMTDGGRINI